MNPIEVHDQIIKDCPDVIAYLEAQPWRSSAVIGNIEGYRTSATVYVPFLSYGNPDCIAAMNKAVWKALDDYANRWGFRFSDVEDVSIQRYEPGQSYKKHVDSDVGHSRVVSAVAYLNTVEEGGQTVFPLQGESVDPVEGRLVIFPSNYVFAHEALPPSVGVKYAAAFWARQ